MVYKRQHQIVSFLRQVIPWSLQQQVAAAATKTNTYPLLTSPSSSSSSTTSLDIAEPLSNNQSTSKTTTNTTNNKDVEEHRKIGILPYKPLALESSNIIPVNKKRKIEHKLANNDDDIIRHLDTFQQHSDLLALDRDRLSVFENVIDNFEQSYKSSENLISPTLNRLDSDTFYNSNDTELLPLPDLSEP